MRKLYDDTITFKNPTFHCKGQTLSGLFFPDGNFTAFEFDQTQRYFDQIGMMIVPGATISTGGETYICVDHHFMEKKPKKLICKAIRTA